MSAKGPAILFAAWALHDVEEAYAFPGTCDALADATGIDGIRMDQRQSWLAVGLMGAFVAFACRRGAQTKGGSRLYRATVAGLGAHAGTHVLASLVRRGYTAGVATALPIMLPGAMLAHREIRKHGTPLSTRDSLAGAAILVPAALACQVLARLLLPVAGSARCGEQHRWQAGRRRSGARSRGVLDVEP